MPATSRTVKLNDSPSAVTRLKEMSPKVTAWPYPADSMAPLVDASSSPSLAEEMASAVMLPSAMAWAVASSAAESPKVKVSDVLATPATRFTATGAIVTGVTSYSLVKSSSGTLAAACAVLHVYTAGSEPSAPVTVVVAVSTPLPSSAMAMATV